VTNDEPNATTLSSLLKATLATALAKNIPSFVASQKIHVKDVAVAYLRLLDVGIAGIRSSESALPCDGVGWEVELVLDVRHGRILEACTVAFPQRMIHTGTECLGQLELGKIRAATNSPRKY
jgi:hypothetical protein